MPGTTSHIPITVDNLINKLKLIPGDWKVQITNSDGVFYIDNIEQVDDCTVEIKLVQVP